MKKIAFFEVMFIICIMISGDNDMFKDILFALELGLRVISAFVLGIVIGIKADEYFQTGSLFLLIGIVLAFLYVMKQLIGVGKHE